MCNIFYQTNKCFNLLHKARLHAQKGGGDKSNTLQTYQCSKIHCDQQMSSRGNDVHEAIMRSPTDIHMDDTEDTMMLETNKIKRAQETKKGGSASKRKKNAELITG